jgi:hypothetical protein
MHPNKPLEWTGRHLLLSNAPLSMPATQGQRSAFIRYPPFRTWPGHSHDPGADGSPRHQNHDDLHACSQQRASGSPEPRRSFVTVRTLIGGSANQTRNCSDLADGLPAERDLVEGLRTPGAFRRPERSERRYYGGPPKNC